MRKIMTTALLATCMATSVAAQTAEKDDIELAVCAPMTEYAEFAITIFANAHFIIEIDANNSMLTNFMGNPIGFVRFVNDDTFCAFRINSNE